MSDICGHCKLAPPTSSLFNPNVDPQAKFDTVIDLATGTGQAALDLAKKFNAVKAFDSSATMLKCKFALMAASLLSLDQAV